MKEGEIILCHKDDVGRISNKMEAQSGHYLINKWEKGQQKTIQCSCCKKIIDLTDSVDYAGAVQQWKDFGEKCYRCGTGRCDCKRRIEAGKAICPKCGSLNIDMTCKTFEKDTVPIWTGYYCYDCGHWWKKEDSNE